jgi:hypothetical protein
MKVSLWYEGVSKPNLLSCLSKRRLRKIHNPLYPPYFKGDSEEKNVYFKGDVEREKHYLKG